IVLGASTAEFSGGGGGTCPPPHATSTSKAPAARTARRQPLRVERSTTGSTFMRVPFGYRWTPYLALSLGSCAPPRPVHREDMECLVRCGLGVSGPPSTRVSTGRQYGVDRGLLVRGQGRAHRPRGSVPGR